MGFHKTLSLLTLGVALAATSPAIVITQWNFNSKTPDGNTATGTTDPAIGSGVASLIGGTTATFASGDASGGSTDPFTGDDSAWNVTTFAAQGQEGGRRGVRFDVSTVGYESIVVSWDHRHSNTSSRFGRLEYTLDGNAFTSAYLPNDGLFDGNLGDTWFNGRSFDLSSISGVANNPNFGFRIVAVFAPRTQAYQASSSSSTYSTSGTWRFDMVTVSGNQIQSVPVPEPGTLLLGIGALGAALGARRRRR